MILDVLGGGGMGDPFIARIVDPLAGAEGPLVLDPLGALVDERALVAGERLFVLVAFDQVLPDLGADAFEEEAHVAEDGVVAKNGVAGLGHVIKSKQREAAEEQHANQEPGGPEKSDQGQEGKEGDPGENGKTHAKAP